MSEDVLMPDTPALPSSAILLGQVAKVRETMNAHADSLDTRAGGTLRAIRGRKPGARVSATRRRSTGSVFTPRDMLTVYRTSPREERQEDDIRTVDRGEVVTVYCAYRGTYGNYPRRFMGCWLDLAPDGLIIRPMLLLAFLWRRIPVAEDIHSAQTRPFASQWEAANWRGSGAYASGGALQQAGKVVISCRTSAGVLEFAVPRPDVPLVLHYLTRRIKDSATGA